MQTHWIQTRSKQISWFTVMDFTFKKTKYVSNYFQKRFQVKYWGTRKCQYTGSFFSSFLQCECCFEIFNYMDTGMEVCEMYVCMYVMKEGRNIVYFYIKTVVPHSDLGQVLSLIMV